MSLLLLLRPKTTVTVVTLTPVSSDDSLTLTATSDDSLTLEPAS